MQVPAKVRRIVVVTVIAALATLFHLLIEGRWFSIILHIMFAGKPDWVDYLVSYSAASRWHEAWVFLLCWLLAHVLITRERLRSTTNWLGGLMTAVAVVKVALPALPASVLNELEVVARGPGSVAPSSSAIGLGPWAMLAAMCLAAWQLGRLGASGSRNTRAAYLWFALWLLGCGFVAIIMWGMLTYGRPLLHVVDDIVTWSLWSFAAGVFLGWGGTPEPASLEPASKVPLPALYPSRHAFSAAVAAVTLTLFHLFVEVMWFPLMPIEYGDMPDATWLTRVWVFASPSYWHIGWVLVLSWLVVYVLLTRRKYP